MRGAVAALWLVLASPLAAQGLVEEDAQEPRIRALAAGLRCPVCQSESLLESQSSTAREMLVILREQVAEGQSDAEITDFFRQRYGDFVMLAPPSSGPGRLIWALPFVLALGGGLILGAAVMRRRRPAAAGKPLSEGDLAEMEP